MFSDRIGKSHNKHCQAHYVFCSFISVVFRHSGAYSRSSAIACMFSSLALPGFGSDGDTHFTHLLFERADSKQKHYYHQNHTSKDRGFAPSCTPSHSLQYPPD